MQTMLQLLLGAVLISFSAVFVKLANVSGDGAAFYRMFFGSAGLLAVVVARATLGDVPPLPRGRALGQLLGGAGLCGFLFALDILCWHTAIHALGPGLATILANFQAVILAAIAYVFLGERRGRRFYIAAPLALAGLWIMVGPQWDAQGETFQEGVWLGLAAAAFYTLFLLALKRTMTPAAGGKVDSYVVVLCISLATALCVAMFMLGRGESFAVPDARSWLALAAYGLFGQVLGWVLVSRGLAGVSTALGGLLLLLQPALSYLWDVLFFAKPVTILELAGAGTALVAIYLGATAGEKSRSGDAEAASSAKREIKPNGSADDSGH